MKFINKSFFSRKRNKSNEILFIIQTFLNNQRRMKSNKMYVSCLLSLFLLTLINCETSLSTNNCPSDFNITKENMTIGIGQSQIATFFYSTYMGEIQKSQIESYIISSDTKAISEIATKQYLWPFIAIGIAFGIAFAIIVLCMVFQKSCPPCQSWRRDFTKRPYQKNQIRCVALFALIFSVAIFSTSIASFIIIPTAQNQLKSTKCAIYGALDVALNGDNKNWGGFTHIKNQVGNISRLLTSTNSQINTFFDDNTAIKDAMDAMKAQNINIYTSNKDAQVSTPDPYASLAAQYTNSWFIQTYLGPQTQADTMVKDINDGLTITQQLSDQATAIVNSAFIIVQSSSTISSNTAASQTKLTMYEDQLNTFTANINTFSNNYFDPIFNWGIYVVEVIVGFVLVASLALIIGAISVQFLEIYDCRHFLHFGWVVYGLTYFGIVFVMFYILPMGSMGYTFCKYYKNMLNNQSQYSRLGQVYSQNVLNKLDTCVNGDGNVLSKFQILNQMNTVSNLFINIGIFNNYDDSTHASYVNQSISTTKIASWITTLTNYRQGITKDVDINLATDANAMIALSKLNQYSLWTTANAGDTIGRCSRDRWVYDVADCTSSQFPFNSTDPQGLTIDMNYVTCISFNLKLSQSSASIWTLADMQKRYKQIKQNCPDAYDLITDYGGSIIRYRDSRINLFQGLIDQVTSLQSSHFNFNALLSAFRSNLTSFSTTQTIIDLSNFVTNKIDGLLVSSDCTPIADRMRFVYNSFCINSMGSAVQLGICMALLLCFMIGGMFTGCIFAQRTATIKRLKQGDEQQNFKIVDSHTINSQTFAKKQKSQTSSSSEDED